VTETKPSDTVKGCSCLAVVIAGVVIGAIALFSGGSSKKPAASSNPAPAVSIAAKTTHPAQQALPALTGKTLSAAEDSAQANGYTNFTSHDLIGTRVQILDSDWKVCTQSPAPGVHPAGTAVSLGVVKTSESCPGQGGSTVTYVVTGSPSDVTYGPAGSNLEGQSPMTVSQKIGSASYYSISAQLDGDGQVTCKIEVNGKAISTASASGEYNVATCEITQDPLNGDWQDANSG
jgi:hypothetical protein